MKEHTKAQNQAKGKTLHTRMGYPIRSYLIPNVSFFRSIPLKYDKILERFGIKRVSEREIISAKHNHGRYNRYLIKMYNKLERSASRKDEKSFHKLVYILQTRSKAMRTALLQRTYPQWYKYISLRRVKIILLKFERIAAMNSEHFDYKRV